MTESLRHQEFEETALIHMDALFKTAYRLTGSREEGEELVQETFIKAFRFFHQFTRGTNCRAWLYKILRNTFFNRLEQDKRRPSTTDLDALEPFLGEEDADIGMQASTDEEMLGRVLEDDVMGALMELPETYRMVVILSDLEGLSYKEIAEVMEVPIGTVMSRLHRGRKALRGRLAQAARRYGIAGEMRGG
ncbi:MAG: sigma-70 family RNA polymerase sigma factor [Leptospirillia bacterium]